LGIFNALKGVQATIIFRMVLDIKIIMSQILGLFLIRINLEKTYEKMGKQFSMVIYSISTKIQFIQVTYIITWFL
jgi:hypothetical protein